MKITIKEIAKKSGFGVGTVSRALNSNPYLVKKETREKILSIAKKYGYIKDVAAQTLVAGKSRDIGLVIPAIFVSLYYNDFYIKLIAGVMEAAVSNGYKLRLLFAETKSSVAEIIKEIKALRLRWVILSPYCGDFNIAKTSIRQLGIPVIALNEHVTGDNINSVVLDDFKGGYDGTNFLIKYGHKKIAIIRGIQKDIEERYDGYKKAMSENKIPIKKEFVLLGDGTEESGYRQTMKLLKKKNRPTAIFGLDDEMAIGAIRAIKENGLRCPEDISVLGFDGMDIGKFTDPRLTTMVRPVSLMGRRAIELLVEEEKPKLLKIEAELANRGSCRKV